jgi:hypothetical protein
MDEVVDAWLGDYGHECVKDVLFSDSRLHAQPSEDSGRVLYDGELPGLCLVDAFVLVVHRVGTRVDFVLKLSLRFSGVVDV